MKLIKFSFILLLMLLIPTPTSGFEKVLEDDTWIYETKDGSITETVVDKFEYIKDDESITLVGLDTKRYYDFGQSLSFSYENISIESNIIFDNIYVTQTGILPVFVRSSYVINVTMKYGNLTYNDIVTMDFDGDLLGTPNKIFTTGENELYETRISGDGIRDQHYIYIAQSNLISSDTAVEASKFNITISQLNLHYVYNIGSDDSTQPNYYFSYREDKANITVSFMFDYKIINFYVPKTGLQLSADTKTTQMSWDKEISEIIPTYIGQVEPVKIESGLQLNALNEFVEYYLKVNIDGETVNEVPLSMFIIPLSLIAIVIIKKRKTF